MASPPGFASHLTDTIVAVASPPGGGARAIVRLSGGQSFPILAALFHPTQERESALLHSPLPYTVLAGEAEFPGWGGGLPALAYLMPAPRSYTREDVAELHLVGSPPVVMAVLEACLEGGARLAEPGEFTRRALVAGRLDLAQAEALLKLVDAPDEATARAAVRELTGWLGNRLSGLAQRLFQLVTQVEATIDFSQEDIQLVTPAEAAAAVEQVQSDVEALLADARKGLVEQLPTVLLFGPANVGKSSLFNRLVGRTTALVTSVPGTTRDAVEAIVPLGDIRLRLLDGAGQWEGFTGLDARAAERTRALLARADLVLHLIDTGQPLTDEDRRLASLAAHTSRTTGRPHLWLLAKSDLPGGLSAGSLAEVTGGEPVLRISARSGEGLDELRAAIRSAFLSGQAGADSAGFLLNARQREALTRAAEALASAQGSLDHRLGEEFVAVDLWEALDALGEVTGRRTSDDVLDAIFSRFCIGK